MKQTFPLPIFIRQAFAAVMILTLVCAAVPRVFAEGNATTTTISDNQSNQPVQQTDISVNPDATLTQDVQQSTSTPDSASGSTSPQTILVIPPCASGNSSSTSSSIIDPLPETATTTTSTDTSIIQNSTTTPESATADPCAPQPLLVADDSAANTTITASSTLEIINTNDLKVINDIGANGVSGQNALVAGDDIRHTDLVTGDVNIYANVLTVANTNLINSQIIQTSQDFNALSTSLLLNGLETDPAQIAQDLVTGICGSADSASDSSTSTVVCQSFSTFKLTNKNSADIQNTIGVNGISGQNVLASGDDVANSSVTTGKVNAVVNVINFVNNNLVNSRLTVVNFNVFGDWSGDLVMPSELYFQHALSLGDGSAGDVSLIKKVVFDIKNDSQANIKNNVNTGSDSGNNTAQAGPDGSIDDVQVTTGDTQNASQVQNIANTNVINGMWYLGLVNTLGGWSGNVYSLPAEVAASTTPNGLSFFATNASNKDGLYQAFDDAISQAQSQSSTTVGIDNQNTANITNNVDLQAVSGQNALMAGDDVRHDQIVTGNARALANILNFVNTNLINADVQVGMVNIFGAWNGNIVFGYPDLSATQKLAEPAISGIQESPVHYQLKYQNSGNASMGDAMLEWHYDPHVLAFSTADTLLPYTEKGNTGVMLFKLGKLAPGVQGTINLGLKTANNILASTIVDSYIRIYGTGPEINLLNNDQTLHAGLTPAGGSQSTASASTGGGGGGGGGGSSASSSTGGNSSGGSTGGSSTSGGGGGGGFSGGSSSAARTGLSVVKTNGTGGATKFPGDVVTFTISIDNYTGKPLSNVIVYDSLKGPDNKTVMTKQIPIGPLKINEGVDVSYDLQINSNAPSGYYNNSAYAEALDGQLKAVHSPETSTTRFYVGTGTGIKTSQADSTTTPDTIKVKKNSTTTPNSALDASDTPEVLGDQTGPMPGINILGTDGTVYFVGDDNMLNPYTSAGAFLSYTFNSWDKVIKAQSEGLQKSAEYIPPRNGSLINDKGTIYLIVGGKRAGFASMKIFKALGYSLANVRPGDTSFMESLPPVNTAKTVHTDGTLINDNGTLYIMKNSQRAGLPSMDVLKSWGYHLKEAVTANAYDKAADISNVLNPRLPTQLNF